LGVGEDVIVLVAYHCLPAGRKVSLRRHSN
jgi:hypothetical protein